MLGINSWNFCSPDIISGISLYSDGVKITGIKSFYTPVSSQSGITEPQEILALNNGSPVGNIDSIIDQKFPGWALTGVRYAQDNNNIITNLYTQWFNLDSTEQKWEPVINTGDLINPTELTFNRPVKCLIISYTSDGIQNIWPQNPEDNQNLTALPQAPVVVCNCGYTWMILAFVIALLLVGAGAYQAGKKSKQ